MRRIEYMPLADIPRAARNPKEHDLAGIRRSIEAFGCVAAGELDARTGRLVVGHGRLQVLEEIAAAGASPPEGVNVAEDGTWLAPIVRGWAPRSDADAEAYLVANNRLTERGGWVDAMLAEVLTDISHDDENLLLAAGYDADELADLDAALARAAADDSAGPHERDEVRSRATPTPTSSLRCGA